LYMYIKSSSNLVQIGLVWGFFVQSIELQMNLILMNWKNSLVCKDKFKKFFLLYFKGSQTDKLSVMTYLTVNLGSQADKLFCVD